MRSAKRSLTTVEYGPEAVLHVLGERIRLRETIDSVGLPIDIWIYFSFFKYASHIIINRYGHRLILFADVFL